jgi:hypothetical protein
MKSLEERIADRKRREKEAEKAKEEQDKVLATGTLADDSKKSGGKK